MHELSRADARRIAVRAQLVDARRPDGLLEMVRGLTLLQHDHTAAVAPNADLIAWSRLGSSYSPGELAAALRDRTLIELRGMIRPSEDLVLYTADMAEWPGPEPLRDWQKATLTWLAANDECRLDILHRLGSDGPLAARDLPDTCAVPWRSTGWNNNRNVSALLDIMVRRGEVGEPAVVEGVTGQWRVDPSLLGQPFSGRTALLSPLDRLVFDRKRMADLFEFDYQLEMYKPAAKRRWGYFALPILHDDRLIGKLDATADRDIGVLRVDAVHQDAPFSPAVTAAVDQEIKDLAHWLGLDVMLADSRS